MAVTAGWAISAGMSYVLALQIRTSTANPAMVMVISSNDSIRTVPTRGPAAAAKHRTNYKRQEADNQYSCCGVTAVPPNAGSRRQKCRVPGMGQSTMLQLKYWLNNGKQHEEHQSKSVGMQRTRQP